MQIFCTFFTQTIDSLLASGPRKCSVHLEIPCFLWHTTRTHRHVPSPQAVLTGHAVKLQEKCLYPQLSEGLPHVRNGLVGMENTHRRKTSLSLAHGPWWEQEPPLLSPCSISGTGLTPSKRVAAESGTFSHAGGADLSPFDKRRPKRGLAS